MVEAARRRAAELGLEGVTFAVEDAASLTLADGSVDGVLCRWGLMLVPDIESAPARSRAFSGPDGRAALAVWADPEENEWMTASGRARSSSASWSGRTPTRRGRSGSPRRRLVALLASAGLEVATVEDVR